MGLALSRSPHLVALGSGHYSPKQISTQAEEEKNTWNEGCKTKHVRIVTNYIV